MKKISRMSILKKSGWRYSIDLEDAHKWYVNGAFKVPFGKFCDNIKLAGWMII